MRGGRRPCSGSRFRGGSRRFLGIGSHQGAGEHQDCSRGQCHRLRPFTIWDYSQTCHKQSPSIKTTRSHTRKPPPNRITRSQPNQNTRASPDPDRASTALRLSPKIKPVQIHYSTLVTLPFTSVTFISLYARTSLVPNLVADTGLPNAART